MVIPINMLEININGFTISVKEKSDPLNTNNYPNHTFSNALRGISSTI